MIRTRSLFIRHPEPLLISVLIAACVGSACRPAGDRVYVGAILPLTGQLSDLGGAMRNAIELAVLEHNTGRPPYAQEVVVVYSDDTSESAHSVAALGRILGIHRVPLVMGPVTSPGVARACEVTAAERIVLATPSASSSALASACGPLLFRFYPSELSVARQVANWMRESGHRRIAVAHSTDAAPVAAWNAFRAAFNQGEGRIVVEVVEPRGFSDFTRQAERLLETRPDAIYAIVEPGDGIPLLRAIHVRRPAAIVYAPEWWEREAARSAGLPPETVRVVAPALKDSLEALAFQQRYRDRYHQAPPLYAAYAYDMAGMVTNVLLNGRTGTDIAVALRRSTYTGITGEITFDPNGDVKDASFIRKLLP